MRVQEILRLHFFDSAKDTSYEVNDTLSTATNISIGSSAVGVLDSPLDIDYYKYLLQRDIL